MAVASLLAATPAAAHAAAHAAVSACTDRVAVAERTSTWAAPLDRIVSVRVPESSLRDALEQVAAAARIELSYSNELLPADRRVCLALDRVPVGAVLETVLAGTSLRLVVTGASQIVLAPTRAAVLPAAATSRRASVLDRVVVTGTPDGAPHRGSPFALDVIDGATLSRTRARSLLDALELAVPGVWTWSGTAGTLSARFGSIRGASSFGVTTPKIYLDGVEVANPLLVTQLDASRIDRVEIIRGPQGAALYGADAISGVISILTRHDGTPSGAPELQLASSAGVAATEFSTRDAFVQNHGLSLRGGSGRGLFGLGLNVSTVGAYVPGASERHLLADGDVRLVRERSVITATARLSVQRANASTGLLYGGAVSPAPSEATTNATAPHHVRARAPARFAAHPLSPAAAFAGGGGAGPDGPPPAADTTRFAGDSASGQEFSHYTVGATATMMPSLHWTNTVIVGLDGYRLRGLSGADVPVPMTYQADASPGQGAADRGSLRARTVGRFDVGANVTLSLTGGLEHALTRETHETPLGWPGARGPSPGGGAGGAGGVTGLQPQAIGGPVVMQTTWINNTGVLAQANLGWRDALFLVAGGRVERTTGATVNPQTAYLPMFGATLVRDLRGMLVKLRGAYGTGIRPAHTLSRAGTWMGRPGLLSGATLRPESQSGVEGGIDLLLGSRLGVHLTRFDQRASGLIQPVASSTVAAMHGRPVRVLRYTLQNVGAIDNEGWELQGSTMVSRLRLSGAYTLVDSRVALVDPSYGGDLRAGDRMLDVPARTLSATAAWSTARWVTSATLTRAEDWIGYDRIAIARALSGDGLGAPTKGADLRDFWTRYDDVTRLRANIAFLLSRQLTVELGGENLLNVQRAGPDNTSVTAGRTVTFGLRAQF